MLTLSEYLLSSNEDSVNLGLHLLLYQDESILEDLKKFAMGNNDVDGICHQLRVIHIHDDIKDRLFKVCDILYDFAGVPTTDLPSEWVVHKTSFEYETSNIQFNNTPEGVRGIDFRLTTMFGRLHYRNRYAFDSVLDSTSYKHKIFVEPFIFANESVVVLSNHKKQPFMLFSNIGTFQCYSKPKYCKINYRGEIYRLYTMSHILDCLHRGCVCFKPDALMITEPYSRVEDAIIVSEF